MMSNYSQFETESGYDEGELEMQTLAGGMQPMSLQYMPPLVRYRYRLRRVVESIWVRLLSLLLIIIDIIILFVRFHIGGWNFKNHSEVPKGLEVLSDIIISYFVVEVSLRIIAFGPKEFFSRKLEVVDFVVIVVAAVLTFVFEFGRLVIFARIVRILIVLRLLNEHKQVQRATRLLISQNKRRYREDGFDLDLTYVTDRIIAMSFPASGATAIYRNPIKEVVRFFHAKHDGHFMIYNTCSEKSYNAALFDNCVQRVGIDDHNVPHLSEMQRLCKHAQAFLEEDPLNVVAIHCKGGKGRTGTMICALMLHMGKFTEAKESLDLFARRRTDLMVSKQFQGVQTPSQARFVGYYASMMRDYGGLLPPVVPLCITTIRVIGLNINAKRGQGSLAFQIIRDGKTVLDFERAQSLGSATVQLTSVTNDAGVVVPCIEYDIGSLLVSNEVKIRFESESLPKAYDKAAFYFWFHTSFINDNRLLIGRNELDNPHKQKTWKLYREHFAVELFFTTPDAVAATAEINARSGDSLA